MGQSTIKEKLENLGVRFPQNTCTCNDLFGFGSNEERLGFISKEECLETYMVPKDPQVRSVRDDSGKRPPEVFGSVRAKHLESGNQQVGWLARRRCTAKLDQPC